MRDDGKVGEVGVVATGPIIGGLTVQVAHNAFRPEGMFMIGRQKFLWVVGALVGIGAFAAPASAVTEPIAACRMVGCMGGEKDCAEVTGSVAIGSVKWFCQKPMPGGGKVKK